MELNDSYTAVRGQLLFVELKAYSLFLQEEKLIESFIPSVDFYVHC